MITKKIITNDYRSYSTVTTLTQAYLDDCLCCLPPLLNWRKIDRGSFCFSLPFDTKVFCSSHVQDVGLSFFLYKFPDFCVMTISVACSLFFVESVVQAVHVPYFFVGTTQLAKVQVGGIHRSPLAVVLHGF